MQNAQVPGWYIETCKKIKYMFPKGHAVAYVTMALRIAYFKVFYPAAYYCCYLARNAESFDATRMTTENVDELRGMIEDIKALDKSERTATKEDEITILEILIEMNLRGVHVKKADLSRSAADMFVIDTDGNLLAPLTTIPGINLSAAEKLESAQKEKPFSSISDMRQRGIGKRVIQRLRRVGCLWDLSE